MEFNEYNFDDEKNKFLSFFEVFSIHSIPRIILQRLIAKVSHLNFFFFYFFFFTRSTSFKFT